MHGRLESCAQSSLLVYRLHAGNFVIETIAHIDLSETITSIAGLGGRTNGVDGLKQLFRYPLFEALLNRRSRRVAAGISIPAGPFAHRSIEPAQPLSALETRILLGVVSGRSGWNYLMDYSARHPEQLPPYATNALGRTFASSGGWYGSRFFFSDDRGIYSVDDGIEARVADSGVDDEPYQLIEAGRLEVPRTCFASHNRITANAAGSILIIPVYDLAQATLELISMAVQGDATIVDDVADGPGQPEDVALTKLEQNALALASAEMAISCHNGALAAEAMGLGGWTFAGFSSTELLCGAEDGSTRGFGFERRFDADGRPMPLGRSDIFEPLCPPFTHNMQAAVSALMERKFGVGGPYHPDTAGPFRKSDRVRASARLEKAQIREIIDIASRIFQTHGRFPVTVSPAYVNTIFQAHHLETSFYDEHFIDGCTTSQIRHQRAWHSADF